MIAPTTSSSSFETLECRDPATLERLGNVPILSRSDVVLRVERGRAAQAAWGRTSFAERRRVLRALLDYTVANQPENCGRGARDWGRTLADALLGEIFPVCEKTAYLIPNGENDLKPQRRPS